MKLSRVESQENARNQEHARSAAGSHPCPLRSSGRLRAKAVVPRIRRGPLTSGPLKKLVQQAARAARSAAVDAGVSPTRRAPARRIPPRGLPTMETSTVNKCERDGGECV